jgi:hypothetical protein
VPTEPDLLKRLTVALDGLAAAMESGDPTAVLGAEAPVATAVSALRLARLSDLSKDPTVRQAILEARLALARCRTLGHASARLTAIVTSGGYGPSGRHRTDLVPVPTVTART